MGRGGKRGRSNGGWRSDNRRGGRNSWSSPDGDRGREQRRYYWQDGYNGPLPQRSCFYNNEYYSESDCQVLSHDSGLSEAFVHSGLQMQQGIVGVAGRDSEFGQGNLFASRRDYEGAVENASDTCLTAAANGPDSGMCSNKTHRSLSAASTTVVGACFQGGVDIAQTLHHGRDGEGINVPNAGRAVCNEDVSEQVSVKLGSRTSSVCSTQSEGTGASVEFRPNGIRGSGGAEQCGFGTLHRTCNVLLTSVLNKESKDGSKNMGLFGASDPTVPASSNDVEQSRRIRTFSLGSTDTTGTRQPVNVCRRYASAYQLACDVSDNKASVNSELDGTFYEGYVHQDGGRRDLLNEAYLESGVDEEVATDMETGYRKASDRMEEAQRAYNFPTAIFTNNDVNRGHRTRTSSLRSRNEAQLSIRMCRQYVSDYQLATYDDLRADSRTNVENGITGATDMTLSNEEEDRHDVDNGVVAAAETAYIKPRSASVTSVHSSRSSSDVIDGYKMSVQSPAVIVTKTSKGDAPRTRPWSLHSVGGLVTDSLRSCHQCISDHQLAHGNSLNRLNGTTERGDNQLPMDVHHKDYYSECQLVSDDTRNEARAVTENTNSSNAGDVDEVDNAFEATLPASDGSNFVSVATGLPSSGDKGHGMSLDVPATVSTDVCKSGRPRIRTLSYHSTKGLMSDQQPLRTCSRCVSDHQLACDGPFNSYVDKDGNEGMPDVHYISEKVYGTHEFQQLPSHGKVDGIVEDGIGIDYRSHPNSVSDLPSMTNDDEVEHVPESFVQVPFTFTSGSDRMDFCRRVRTISLRNEDLLPSINASRRYVSDYHLDYGDMPDGGIRSTAESVSVTNVDQQIGAANKVILPAVNGADFVSVSSGLPIPFDQGNNNDVVKRAQACMDFMEEPQVNTAVRLSRAPSARSVRSSVSENRADSVGDGRPSGNMLTTLTISDAEEYADRFCGLSMGSDDRISALSLSCAVNDCFVPKQLNASYGSRASSVHSVRSGGSHVDSCAISVDSLDWIDVSQSNEGNGDHISTASSGRRNSVCSSQPEDVRTAVGYTNSVEMGRDKPEHTKNVAELILPVNRPHRVAPRSNSVLQSFVNVLNVSAANDLPDDRCGSHLGSIAETRMELGEVNSSKSNVDCARTIQPLREVECVTPVTVRAHSNSNTPSALNRTCYSRAEFEQKKLTMAVTAPRQSYDGHSAQPSQMFLSGSPRYIVTSESTVGQTKKLGEEAGKQRCVGHNSTMICDEHLTIRGRIPRGQTRRLASLFEDLTTAVANEAVGHPCSLTPGRNKSVPARASPMAYKQQNLDERRSLGGTILGGRCQDGRKFSADESVGRPASSNHNGHERFVERCPSQPFLQSRYAENMTRVRVQSLVNRFEPNRGDGQRCDALMTEEIQTAQRSQSHWQHTLALHERHPAMVEIGSDYSGLSNSPRISNMRRGEICEKRRPQSAAGRRRVSTAVSGTRFCQRFTRKPCEGAISDLRSRLWVNSRGVNEENEHERFYTDAPSGVPNKAAGSGDASRHGLHRFTDWVTAKPDEALRGSIDNTDAHKIPGCGDLNVERDHSSGGDGNLAHFTGVHVQEADAACTRTIHKTNILLGSEENAVGVHPAKGFAGLQQPPLDSAQKEPCLDRSSSLSDISTTTIGEMNDRADYVKMAKRLKEAMCMQESHISEIMETLAFYGKNKVRKFAKIYTERELLLCRERYSVLHRELQRVEALLSKYKRIPQLSQSVQSTCEVSSITVQLCRNFRTGSIGEKGSYAFVALLKTGERVDATEAVSLIDCGVGTVRFGSHFHFTALPLDFGIVIEIYAMKFVAARGNARRLGAAHEGEDSAVPQCHSKKPVAGHASLNSPEFMRCGAVILNRSKVGTKRFTLDDAVCPLDGSVEVMSHCSDLPPILGISFGGFLNSMEMMMGDASWIRYWAVLHCGSLSFWRDSDEQASDKPPLSRIDLTKCTNKKITPAACESSGAKVFVINHLVESSSGLFEEKRLSLSADTEQVCLSWIKTINETLGILRA